MAETVGSARLAPLAPPSPRPVAAQRSTMLERFGVLARLLVHLLFRQVRVRHHDKLARIEVERSEISRLIEDEMSHTVTEGLRKIGYTYVTVDLLGYRTGSMNEGFFKKKKS